MKSIITGLLLFAGFTATAQFDMEIAITSPADGAQFNVGDNVVLDIEITNWGDVLPQDDTLYIAWVVDGVFYGPNLGTLQGASVAGGGVPFGIPSAGNFSGLGEGQHTICAWIVGLGSQLFGQNFDLNGLSSGDPLGNLTISDIANGDPTPLNNEHCINITVIDPNASISDVDAENIQVYPNPATDVLMVDGTETGSMIEVVDAMGQVVLKEVVVGETKLSLSNLQSGVYYVRISNDSQQLKMERIIVRK